MLCPRVWVLNRCPDTCQTGRDQSGGALSRACPVLRSLPVGTNHIIGFIVEGRLAPIGLPSSVSSHSCLTPPSVYATM
jgi:hypothetical protein